MNVVIIKYNAGNIQSVLFALNRVGVSANVSDNPEVISAADKVIFPGVGEASSAMRFLREKKLDTLIKELKQPVLGICLGMQLLCSFSEEGNTKCLEIFPQKVKKFTNPDLKTPQIGWNTINKLNSPLFRLVEENSYVYFVHGYYVETGAYTISETNYGIPYSSALNKDNFFGTQFHPEKSGDVGEKILKNFIELT